MSSVVYYWVSLSCLAMIAVSAACGARALYLLTGVVADLAAAVDSAPPATRSRHAPAAVAAATAAADPDWFVEPPAQRSSPPTVSLPIAPDDGGHGPLCKCGHYRDEHDRARNNLGFYGCQGKVGEFGCTCQGFRQAGARR